MYTILRIGGDYMKKDIFRPVALATLLSAASVGMAGCVSSSEVSSSQRAKVATPTSTPEPTPTIKHKRIAGNGFEEYSVAQIAPNVFSVNGEGIDKGVQDLAQDWSHCLMHANRSLHRVLGRENP